MRKFHPIDKILGGTGIIILTGAIAAGAAGCGANSSRGVGDSRVGPQNKQPAYIVNMPDGFSNLSWKCVDPGKSTVAAFSNTVGRTLVIADAGLCPLS